MSQSTWLVAGIAPGINRQPLKKLAADEATLLELLYRWRDEATKAGRTIVWWPSSQGSASQHNSNRSSMQLDALAMLHC